MDVEEGGYVVGSEIQRLPEECLSHAILLTSPRDACRSEAVSAAFRSASASDNVWRSFLPSDYAEILARAVDRVEFASMKHLYFRLCDPILIDGGKMGFFVDKETGVKCFILPARELLIIWGDTPQYWRWNHDPESRFPEVAELMNVCWLEIRGRINSRLLSKRSNYSAYLIFKLSSSAAGFNDPPQKASVTIGADDSPLSVRLMEEQNFGRPRPILRRPRYFRNFFRRANFPQEPPEDLREPLNELHVRDDLPEEADEARHDRRQNPDVEGQDQSERDGEIVGRPQLRQDGWMEILLGEFYNEDGDDGEVVMSFLEIKGGHWKSGLIVQGIEIRPKKGVCM
ncbi:putative F-box protein PP2-B12 [Phalaenopsis equestris]|uniref:putative F-box protein PP2-B12 n=1 Tax=Phalaenopsis equestris TaxID=78828 RepID=UPI0009E34803|nr:putative F-box protein PP2-B12 [Phalaenopsis equestris]